jgi:hypothetical protein
LQDQQNDYRHNQQQQPETSKKAAQSDVRAELTKKAAQTNTKVRVVHGSNEQYFDLAGKDVAYVRKNLRDVFNIPKDAAVWVNGKSVDEDFILQPSQSVEFLKSAGVKGDYTGLEDLRPAYQKQIDSKWDYWIAECQERKEIRIQAAENLAFTERMLTSLRVMEVGLCSQRTDEQLLLPVRRFIESYEVRKAEQMMVLISGRRNPT